MALQSCLKPTLMLCTSSTELGCAAMPASWRQRSKSPVKSLRSPALQQAPGAPTEAGGPPGGNSCITNGLWLLSFMMERHRREI